MNETIPSGEVICKITASETKRMKKACVAIESIDQQIYKLTLLRVDFSERKTEYWEELFDKYLLVRGLNYNINWKTGEIIKL